MLGAAVVAPAQAFVESDCLMNCSSLAVTGAAPPTLEAEKFCIIHRRLAGANRARSSFAFVASNFHLVIKMAISLSSLEGPPPDAAVVVTPGVAGLADDIAPAAFAGAAGWYLVAIGAPAPGFG